MLIPDLLLMIHTAAVIDRVKACISIVGFDAVNAVKSDVRAWYQDVSLVVLPSSHPIHLDAKTGSGKYHKKLGNVVRASTSFALLTIAIAQSLILDVSCRCQQ